MPAKRHTSLSKQQSSPSIEYLELEQGQACYAGLEPLTQGSATGNSVWHRMLYTELLQHACIISFVTGEQCDHT